MQHVLRFCNKVLLFPRRSIHAKLILIFLVVAIIPLVILGTMAYRKSAAVIQTQFGNYGQYVMTQLQFQIDSTLSQMQIVAHDINSYLLDPTLIVLREEVPHTYNGFLAQKNFERYLDAHRTIEMKGIFIINKSGYYYGRNQLDIQVLRDESWWKAIPSSLDKDYWIGFYEPRHYVGNHGTEASREKVLGLVVPIKSRYGVMQDSRIFIEMSADKLFHLFHQLEQDMSALITIKDQTNRSIYVSQQASLPMPTDIVWSKQLEANGWKIEVRIPASQFYRSSDVIRSLMLAVIGGCLIVVLMLAYLLSAPLTKRIKRLEESMRLVGTGELKTRTRIDSQDEIGLLEESFNQMVKQIQSLVAEVSKTEAMKKEAELRAFHYQINPHLLFNTLNSIQWQARLQGANQIDEMLYHLIMVLEGNLDFSQELIPLQKELKTLEHFLCIQQIRFGNSFRFHLQIGEHLERYLIPRMSLQPLFENIFFHAFEDGQGSIELIIEEAEEMLLLTLQDDGIGIRPERLAYLLDPTVSRKEKRGLGIVNVDQKFKLHFGPACGLSIDAEPGGGTTITIRWPKREELSHAG